MKDLRIGISGWTYEPWRETFYPKDLAHKLELEYASQKFNAIEINGTFYALQNKHVYETWYERTPPDFKFSVKANRYITHIKKLHDVKDPVKNFLNSGLLALKEKLGPILWQLPPSLGFDPDRMETFFKLLPRELQHALEVRHVSFYNPWFVELARKYKIAIVFADTAGKWPYLEDVTSDFIYVRLHGDSELYVSGYNDPTLSFWAQRVTTWNKGQKASDQMSLLDEFQECKGREVYVFFDNDTKVLSPRDALSLRAKTDLLLGPKVAL